MQAEIQPPFGRVPALHYYAVLFRERRHVWMFVIAAVIPARSAVPVVVRQEARATICKFLFQWTCTSDYGGHYDIQ